MTPATALVAFLVGVLLLIGGILIGGAGAGRGRTCRACGQANPAKARYCGTCGKPLT